MKRQDWRTRLLAALDALERVPHVYGQSDCLMRVGQLAAVQLEEPKSSEITALMERYRGRYNSLAAALKLLRADGLTPLMLVRSYCTEIHPVDACDGDIGALKQDGRNWSFGVYVGAFLYVSTEAGLGILPRSQAKRAFRVE